MGSDRVPVAGTSSPAPTRAGDQLRAGPGAPVPVVPRVAEQPPVPVQQAEVVAPRVDADAGDGSAGAGDGRGDPRRQLRVQREDVPVQPVGQRHRPVGEPVHLGDRQPAVAQRPRSTRPLSAPRSTARYSGTGGA